MTTFDDKYWEWCAAGELRLQRCSACRHWRFPPSASCPECLSDIYSWEQVSGRGTVWSWIRMHQRYFPEGSFDLPYVVAFIDLDEGARMISTLLFDSDSEPKLGAKVALEFQTKDDLSLPVFRMVEAGSARGEEG